MLIVAAVAAEEPEVAANIAHAPMLECIRPPGSHENHLAMASYMRSATPERSISSPISMNIGTATTITSLEAPQLVSPIALTRGNGE